MSHPVDELFGRRRQRDDEPSHLELERYFNGELEGTEAGARVAAQVASSERARAYLDSLRATASELEDELTLRRLTVATERRARRWRPSPWLTGALAAAAAAVVVIAIAVGPGAPLPHRPTTYGAPTERPKGGEVLELVVQRSDGSVARVLPGGELAPDDAIRLLLTSDRPAHVGVVGLDSGRAVTIYHPRGPRLAPLDAGQEQALPGSVVLDATLGPERLVAVFCDAPRATDDLRRAGERALAASSYRPAEVARLDLACRQASFLFRKVPRGRP